MHDGVLQSLAFIHRRGCDLGGEAARLGSSPPSRSAPCAARDRRPPDQPSATVDGAVDLWAALTAPRPARHVVAPADPVVVDRGLADEVDAAVDAALDNVAATPAHGAQAWVLVDDSHGSS